MTRNIDYAIISHTTHDQVEIVSISIYFSSKEYHCLKIENALSSINRCFVLDITYNLRK